MFSPWFLCVSVWLRGRLSKIIQKVMDRFDRSSEADAGTKQAKNGLR